VRLGLSTLDLRIGLRMLARYPVLTAAGTVAMAVAIALGTVYFEATHKLRNPRLPIPDAERVISLHQWDVERLSSETALLNDFAQWRAQLTSIESLGAAISFTRNLATDDQRVEPVVGAEISASAFELMGTPAALGRTLLARDEQAGEEPVAVIGHDLWRSRFDRDPNIIGRAVQLGSVSMTIVGVMPEGFKFPRNHQFWTALRAEPSSFAPRTGPSAEVFGRLVADRSLADASAELEVLSARLAADQPQTHQHLRARVLPYAKPLAEGGDRRVISNALVAVNGIFLLLLAVMCANVATLISARTATRSWEFTVRSALGASRRRIIKQLFVEGLVLTLTAAVLGLAIAKIALSIGVQRFALTGGLPFWIRANLSVSSLVYAFALAVFAAAIIGVVPAMRATRGNIQQALRSHSSGGGSLKFGAFWTALIVMQVALTVFFLPLAGGGVFESNRFNQRAEGIGAERFVIASLAMDQEEYGLDSASRAQRGQRAAEEFERRLAEEPGVQAVAFADRVPVEDQFKYRIDVDSSLGAPITPNRHSTLVHVAGNFFGAFDAPVVAGRGFEPLDFDAGRVMMVNQAFVQYVLGGANAVGQRIRIVGGEISTVGGDAWYEIVGVIQDFGWQLPRPEEQSAMYLPSRPVVGRAQQVIVRTGDAEAVVARMRSVAAAVDPTLRLTDLAPLRDAGGSEAGINWTITIVAGLIVSLVMLLCAMGIHALMSFTVARRTREIGIRVALGAGARQVVTGIFWRAFVQLGAGLAIGSGLGVLAGLRSPTQLALLAGANLLMLAVGLAACVVPVRRALRIQPAEALRSEG
jgi:putative ABC transport system permease protein